MDNYCIRNRVSCEFANTNGCCRNTACTKIFSVTYEAYGMRPLTNADKIRSMSDKELAAFLAYKLPDDICDWSDLMLKWLREPSDNT